MSRRKHNQSDNTRATISSRKTGKENNASEDAKAHSREARQRRKGVNQGRNKQLNNRMTENTLISSKSYQLTVHMKLFSTSVSKLSTPLSSGSTNPCPTEDKTKDVREWTVNTPPRTQLALHLGSKEVLSPPTSGQLILTSPITRDVFTWINFPSSTSPVSMNGSIFPKRQRPTISSTEEFSNPPVLGSASQPLVMTRSPHSPQYEIHSTLSDVLSVRAHWMEKQVYAHASHLAGLSQS